MAHRTFTLPVTLRSLSLKLSTADTPTSLWKPSEQTWNGQSTADGRCTATISRNGDLIHKMYIELQGVTAGGGVAKPENPGSAWITDAELEIGGRVKTNRAVYGWKHGLSFHSLMKTPIVLHTQHLMGAPFLTTATYRLALQAGAGIASRFAQNNRQMAGGPGAGVGAGVPSGTLYQITTGMGGVVAADTAAAAASALTYHVPLMFWFCRNPGLALPLIALQYHEVKINLNHIIGTVFNNPVNNLWVDYIYLDTDERRRFAQVSHEYLIEQVQEQTLSGTATDSLHFNHPVKELVIVNPATTGAAVTNTSLRQLTGGNNMDMNVVLKLNGHDRFAERPLSYFTRTQVNQYHTGCGGLNTQQGQAGGSGGLNNSIFVYSFALKPEEHQPSGTCNFSCNTALVKEFTSAGASGPATFQNTCVCFAVNYNVLRIMSGMGGLAYSN